MIFALYQCSSPSISTVISAVLSFTFLKVLILLNFLISSMIFSLSLASSATILLRISGLLPMRRDIIMLLTSDGASGLPRALLVDFKRIFKAKNTMIIVKSTPAAMA